MSFRASVCADDSDGFAAHLAALVAAIAANTQFIRGKSCDDLTGDIRSICSENLNLAEPLELLGPSSELDSDVDYTLINRSRSHFPGIFDWRQVVETLARPTLIVIDPPRFDLYPCFVNGFKPVHVQAFIPQ